MAEDMRRIAFASNSEEITRFKQMLAKSGKKRGMQGAFTTASSMMAAAMDMLSFSMGPEAAREMFDESAAEFEKAWKANHPGHPARVGVSETSH